MTEVSPWLPPDHDARQAARDPRLNVVLEASAGTGKTSVLVDRYLSLLREGVQPRHILALTFTRKAAAEMRERVVQRLTRQSREGSLTAHQQMVFEHQQSEIALTTIDAFCLSLLLEFPLEAGVDPGMSLADETMTPHLRERALDQSLRWARGEAQADEPMAVLLSALSESKVRAGLAMLLERRLVARRALRRFLTVPPQSVHEICARLWDDHRESIRQVCGSLAGLCEAMAPTDLGRRTADALAVFAAEAMDNQARLRHAHLTLRWLVLTNEGQPRAKNLRFLKADYPKAAGFQRWRSINTDLGPRVKAASDRYESSINRVMVHATDRLLGQAMADYQRVRARMGVLDFTDVLDHAVQLLQRRDEFSQSRYKLESRYQHILVDEFQDTNPLQWALVRELVSSWSEGASVADTHLRPSIFIVGDRKQSIYGFRDAQVALLSKAGRHIHALRPEGAPRRAIAHSFRSVWPVLRFVNDVFHDHAGDPASPQHFQYGPADRFPEPPPVPAADIRAATDGADVAVPPLVSDEPLGLLIDARAEDHAERLADEIVALLASGALVRRGPNRADWSPVQPGDIAVLFRTRSGHRAIEEALQARRVPFYVYKGLGFFDSDEVRDLLALLNYLAAPASDLHAAALLRSRWATVSDIAIRALAPEVARACDPTAPAPEMLLAAPDAERLRQLRASLAEWLPLVEQMPPAELLDRVLADGAYAVELVGPSAEQARENVKKFRGLVRRIQNRGYATLARVVAHFDRVQAAGDEANAIIEATRAVNLMTVHASKGLEFPVVFLVNLDRRTRASAGDFRLHVTPAAAPADSQRADDEDDDAVDITIGPYKSTADDARAELEKHDSRRLMYVALTRARDRLYLTGVRNKQDRFTCVSNSFGGVLPASLIAQMDQHRLQEPLVWSGPSGPHRFRVVPAASATPVVWNDPADAATLRAIPVRDYAPMAATAPSRVVASAASTDDAGAIRRTVPTDRSSARLGTVVHALVAHAHLHAVSDETALHEAAQALAQQRGLGELTPDELARAVRMTLEALRQPELAGASPQASVIFEAAYSRRRDGETIERGSIDVLIVEPSRATVLELKTGQTYDSHLLQLDAYRAAVQAQYPGYDVAGRVVYLQDT
jgi:ATP-dependent helicase/nuclease subunit A